MISAAIRRRVRYDNRELFALPMVRRSAPYEVFKLANSEAGLQPPN